MSAIVSSSSSSLTRLIALVGVHHGIPAPEGEEKKPEIPIRESQLSRAWKKCAREHHLIATRRRVNLDEIPENAYPVALELENGNRFVLLVEKTKNLLTSGDAYIVQFPDSRAALVRDKRIREMYDGTCIFFQPHDKGSWGGWRRWRQRFEKKWIRPFWSSAQEGARGGLD